MKSLAQYRVEIDEIDESIVKLLVERFKIVVVITNGIIQRTERRVSYYRIKIFYETFGKRL